MPVVCTVDMDRRRLHARLHSAGHLIDVAVSRARLTTITATKGYHFADGPYVEYTGDLAEPEQYIPILSQILAKLIAADMPVDCVELSSEKAEQRGIHAPVGKSVRLVGYRGCEPCGCGGTHVRSSSEIGAITLRKIGMKKGIIRMSYEIV